MAEALIFSAIYAKQSPHHEVITFSANASQVLKFSTIDRAGRDETGRLSGFQRPQIAGHIRDIRDYFEQPDAVLPNPIVVAFLDGVSVSERSPSGHCLVTIDTTNGKPGLVVDGQQRLTALAQTSRTDFQIFVSAILCRDEAELKRQFVLVNSARPLPKSLIYELLPGMHGLSRKMRERAVAAALTAELNFASASSLRGLIRQHTHPGGMISDTAIQKVILNSISDGCMRELLDASDGFERCFNLISEFYWAVQDVFPMEWVGHTPKSSRLLHGAGIVSMGHVMEVLAYFDGARTREEFKLGLACLVGQTAWTAGEWDFGNEDRRSWRAIQNVSGDIAMLADFLIREVRADQKSRLPQKHKASVASKELNAVAIENE